MEPVTASSVPVSERHQLPRFGSAAAVKLWLSERFAHERDPQAILRLVAETLGTYLGATRVGYGEIEPGDNSITVSLDWTDGVESMVGRHQLFRDSAIVREYLLGRTLVVSDVSTLDISAAERTMLDATHCRSFVSVPLIHGGEFVALFSVTHRQVREWHEDEVELIAQTGARTWSALQHARTLARLKTSEEQFRTLAETVPGICWIASPDGAVTWINRMGRNYLGGFRHRPESATEVIHPDERDETMADWQSSLATGEPLERVVRLRGADGQFRPFLSRAEPVRDAEGHVIRWCVVQVDLSERHAQEHRQALLRSFSDRTRDMADPDAILALMAELIGEELRIARFSYVEVSADDPNLFQRFAWRHGELHGWVDRAFNFDEQLRTVLHMHRHGVTFVSDDMIADAATTPGLDGFALQYGVRSAVAAPIVKEGRLLASLSVLDEVPRRWTRDEIELVEELAERGWAAMARARAEAEMLDREEQFRTLAESIPALCWLAGPDGRAYWGNRRWYALFAGTPAIDGDPTGTVHPDDLERATGGWQEAMRTGTALEMALCIRGRDDIYRPYRSSVVPIRDAAGQVARWCGTLIDLSEQHAHERRQQLLRNFADQTRDATDPAAVFRVLDTLLRDQLDVGQVAYSELRDPGSMEFRVHRTRGDPEAPDRAELIRYGRGYEGLTQRYLAGETVVIGDVAELSAEVRRDVSSVGIASGINVPLIKEGRLVAVLSVMDGVPRGWTTEEVGLVEEVADRAWVAMTRARAEAELRVRERNQAFLIDWSDHVRGVTSPDAIIGTTLELLGHHLGVARATHAEADGKGEFCVTGEWHDAGIPSIRGNRFRLPDVGAAVDRAWVAGETIRYADTAHDPRLEPPVAERYRRANIAAFISVPLIQGGQIRSALSVQSSTPRAWRDGEVHLLREVAERTWGALERARAESALQERERNQAFLIDWGDRLRQERDPQAILTETLARLGAFLDTSRATYVETDEAYSQITVVADWRPDRPGLAGTVGPLAILGPAVLDHYGRGLPLQVDDMTADPRFGEAESHLHQEGETFAFLAVPLVRDGRVAAVLSVQQNRPRHWSEREFQLVRDVADRTWVTLERARAEAALKAREADRAFLLEWSDALRGETSPDRVVATTLERLARYLGVSRANFAESTEDERGFAITQEWRRAGPDEGEPVPARDGISDGLHQAYLAGEIVRVENVRTDPRIGPEARERYVAVEAVAFLGIPLVRSGRVRAVLSVQNAAARVWQPAEVQLLADIADRTWVALERARAEEQLQERERNQAFLIAWSDRIRGESSPRAILALTLERLGSHLDASRINYGETDRTGVGFDILHEWRADGAGSVMGHHFPFQALGEPMYAAHLTGQPVIAANIATSPLFDTATRPLYDSIGLQALLNMPLVRHDRLEAALSIQQTRPRAWTPSEIELTREVADRTWAVLERARAEEALQERERNQAFLIDWNDSMRRETTPRAMLETTLANLGAFMSVSRAGYGEFEGSDGAEHLHVLHEWKNGVVEIIGQRLPIDTLGRTLIDWYRDGHVLVAADLHDHPLIAPEVAAFYNTIGIRSSITVPLMKEGRLGGVISIHQDMPRHWTETEVELVQEVADRARDLLERARSEERLAESEALLAAFMENAPLGMHLKDAAGRYIRINPELAEALGRPMEEIVGAHPDELFPPTIAEVLDGIEVKARAGELASAEFHGGDRDRWRSVMSMVFPIKGRGLARTAGLTIDITERKQAEDALARSREALYQTEKLSALGSLLAGVSHELNNPLSIVVAQAVMMERQTRGTEIAERAQKVRRAADRCARIVQTFLAMARQKRPEREPVDLNGVVTAALELADYGLRTEGIGLTKQLAPDLPPIPADADQLHQIVINLVINAQQAMVQAGVTDKRLTISTARGQEPDTVILDVADSGPGVPVEVQRRIFEPFYTTKPQGEGTGVGLSFSQGLAEAHGGRLVLVPSATGATFRLTLPIDAGQTLPKVAPEAPAKPELVQRRALVIDDEEEIAESLADFLSVEGYDTEIAVGGRAAMALLAAGETYDLVVSDLRMPEMDGPELHAWIARERPELIDRLAFATGDTLGAAVARFLEEAKRPVLEKPFMPDAVQRFLKQVEDA